MFSYHGYASLSESICVVTSDGRIILGELVGHDQVQNLILNDAKERVYSNGSPPEILDLGLYVYRMSCKTKTMNSIA
jgi:small nuclear ribonucleoprotein (snRNP)-like protein